MSKKETEKPAKGKGGMLMKLGLGVALLAAGGGGAFAMMQAGIIGGGKEHVDPSPKLIVKDGEDPYAVESEGKEGEVHYVHGEGGSKYRKTYFTFSDEFTSNLRHSDGLVQLSLATSTRRDGRVIMWLKEHELAIRSKILIVLADTAEEEILTPKGKQNLQQRLTKAINEVLEETEGFGGVDDVYFRSFIVQ